MLHSHPNVPLQKHLCEVGESSRKIVSSKNLNTSVVTKEQLEELSYLIGIAHDFGKATTFFQARVAGKNISKHTHHAPISSLFAYVLGKQLDPEKRYLAVFAYLTVRYHHSNLYSPERRFSLAKSVQVQLDDLKKRGQFEELESIYAKLLPESIQFSKVFEELERITPDQIHRTVVTEYLRETHSFNEEQKLELFLCCNFLFSVLVDCDKKSAGNLNTDYFEGAVEPIIDVGEFIKHKRSEEPEKFDPDIPINKLRNLFFKQTTENKKIEKNQFLYTITAPTGIGKTFTAFGVANKLKEIINQEARIIYALPFTSIVDQNYGELKKILKWSLNEEFESRPTKYLLKHHYLSPMEIQRDKADEEKEKAKNYTQYYDDRILNESWDSAHIVTTFVQLLESIISHKNRQLKKLHNITNSILILDEVQNIPAKFHVLIGKLLKVLAERFNTYIILMTATQPSIFKEEDAEELANVQQFFKEESLNRVEVNYLNELEPLKIDGFTKIIEDNYRKKSVLCVCNTKKTARKIYHEVKNSLGFNESEKIYCLTTLLTPKDRECQIKKIKSELDADKTVICISTQLIEAGVDLSFPVVYRDIGPFDSIVQVAGRCNRNGELDTKGQLYLYKLKDEKEKFPSDIYDNILLNYTDKVLEDWTSFKSKDFLPMAQQYFGSFDMSRTSRQFLTGICNLNYAKEKKNNVEEEPINEFELIKENDNQCELIICSNPKVEAWVEKLEENRKHFEESDPYTKERKSLIGEALELKQELANYTITLYDNQLEPYRDAAEINERFDGKLQFVPYVYYEGGKIYNKKTGFILNPESTTQLESF